jgi:hypothetical protein
MDRRVPPGNSCRPYGTHSPAPPLPGTGVPGYYQTPLRGALPFQQNLVKGVEAGFWDQVVDSRGEINWLICHNYPMRYDIIEL